MASVNLVTAGGGSGAGTTGNNGIAYTGLVESLEDAGLEVNPVTVNLYNTYHTLGTINNELPVSDYTPSTIASYYGYSDAAVITFSRQGTENKDLATNQVEDHANPDDHVLQLDDNEVALVHHVKEHFSKVIVVINSSNIMQIPELAEEKTDSNLGVDAILWVRLINFAHGDVFMCAGLMMVFMCASLPVYVSIPLMLVLTVLLGFVIERAAYKPLRSAPRMSVMISAIGVSYLLQNVALYATGGQPQTYPSLPFVSGTVTILGASTHWVTVITPVLVIVLVLLLQWLINHTKIGMAMRAVAKDFETSQLMGIKINKVISVTFIIGSFLAAVGSLLYFTNYPTVIPTSGAMPGLKAFVAAVFGGIGSIPGAVIGAFIIGICETLIKGTSMTVFSDAFTFALLIVVLVVKPTGLFGEKATDKV